VLQFKYGSQFLSVFIKGMARTPISCLEDHFGSHALRVSHMYNGSHYYSGSHVYKGLQSGSDLHD